MSSVQAGLFMKGSAYMGPLGPKLLCWQNWAGGCMLPGWWTAQAWRLARAERTTLRGGAEAEGIMVRQAGWVQHYPLTLECCGKGRCLKFKQVTHGTFSVGCHSNRQGKHKARSMALTHWCLYQFAAEGEAKHRPSKRHTTNSRSNS